MWAALDLLQDTLQLTAQLGMIHVAIALGGVSVYLLRRPSRCVCVREREREKVRQHGKRNVESRWRTCRMVEDKLCCNQ
jgi:hypothetical protein